MGQRKLFSRVENFFQPVDIKVSFDSFLDRYKSTEQKHFQAWAAQEQVQGKDSKEDCIKCACRDYSATDNCEEPQNAEPVGKGFEIAIVISSYKSILSEFPQVIKCLGRGLKPHQLLHVFCGGELYPQHSQIYPKNGSKLDIAHKFVLFLSQGNGTRKMAELPLK